MVKILSFSSSIVLVAIIAGTLHPKPITNGITAFPGKPNLFIILSVINGILAMYPLSSKKDMAKNKNANIGKNTNTAPTPEITPSANNDAINLLDIDDFIISDKNPKKYSIIAENGFETSNVNLNNIHKNGTISKVPTFSSVKTSSSISVVVNLPALLLTTSLTILSITLYLSSTIPNSASPYFFDSSFIILFNTGFNSFQTLLFFTIFSTYLSFSRSFIAKYLRL